MHWQEVEFVPSLPKLCLPHACGKTLPLVTEDAGGVPDAAAAELHVIAKAGVLAADRLPVPAGLPPGMDAFLSRLDQALSRPAFGADLAREHAAAELAVDVLEALAPIMMPLQVDAGLVLRMAFGLGS